MLDILIIITIILAAAAIILFFMAFVVEDEDKYKCVIGFIICILISVVGFSVISVISEKIYQENYAKYIDYAEESEGILINNKNVLTILQGENEIHFKSLNNTPKVNDLKNGEKIKFKYVKNKALIIEILENK